MDILGVLKGIDGLASAAAGAKELVASLVDKELLHKVTALEGQLAVAKATVARQAKDLEDTATWKVTLELELKDALAEATEWERKYRKVAMLESES